MRVTLVDNLVLPEQRNLDLLDVHPHLGLLSLAAVAIAEGHQLSIYDPKRRIRSGALPYDETLYERVADELLQGSPEAVGFTTLGCSFLFALGVARFLELRAPDLPLLLGGPHATMLAKPILDRYSPFDVVVRHEGELTFPAVLAALESRDFGGVPGVTWRAPSGIEETTGSPRIDDLDGLPLLDYELYPMAELDLDLVRIEAGRGCPFACTFCSTATFFQRRYRLKSPGRLVSEMDAVAERYAPAEFKLDHDLFTVNRRKVAEFCDEVRGHGHRWRVSARVDCVDEALLESMADAGCVGMYFGIETGSPRMQKISAKRLRLDLVEPVLDVCERLGIEATTSFITGYPEETQDDQDATLDLLGACFSRTAGTCIPQLHLLTPEPGTPLFDQLGPSLRYDGYATPFNAWTLREEDREEVRRGPEIFSTYYYYPATLDRRTHVAVIEAVDLLRTLDHRLLTALIRRHGGSLALLVRNVVDSGGLEEHVRARFGDGDPVTSAVRYVFFMRRPLAQARPANGVGSVLRMPVGAQILHDVHDCDAVAAWLEGSGAPDPRDLPRASYMRWPGQAQPVRVDPDVLDLVRLFGTGRGTDDVARLLDVDGAVLEPWVPRLVGAGLLVRSGAES
ncbi:MAG: RiPP biosynthesis radical SAM protein ApyD [Acidimicrobiales bacterium]